MCVHACLCVTETKATIVNLVVFIVLLRGHCITEVSMMRRKLSLLPPTFTSPFVSSVSILARQCFALVRRDGRIKINGVPPLANVSSVSLPCLSLHITQCSRILLLFNYLADAFIHSDLQLSELHGVKQQVLRG